MWLMMSLPLKDIDVIWLFVDEKLDKLPTLYWLHKLYKRLHKSRFIVKSSSCVYTFDLLCHFCLRPCYKIYRMVIFNFGPLKIQVRLFIN